MMERGRKDIQKRNTFRNILHNNDNSIKYHQTCEKKKKKKEPIALNQLMIEEIIQLLPTLT